MKMNVFIGVLLLIGGVSLISFGVYVLWSTHHTPDPWTIVCDGDNHYAFVDYAGELDSNTFGTIAECTTAMEESKKWHADYRAGKFKESYAAKEREKEERLKRFSPCPPANAPKT